MKSRAAGVVRCATAIHWSIGPRGRMKPIGDYVGPPAWVFITPNTCFATAKGDLVSPGRSGNGFSLTHYCVQKGRTNRVRT